MTKEATSRVNNRTGINEIFQISYKYWRQRAKDIFDEAEADNVFTKEERAKLTLAEDLKETIEETKPDLGVSMFSDLLNAAMSEVDYYEIAANFIDEERS